jgi:AMP deaminase
MVQVPRIYRIFRKIGKVKSFQDVLDNFFEPLFAATLEPEKYPYLSRLLTEISGFDSVDDESIHESRCFEIDVKPRDWTSLESPSYVFFFFFFPLLHTYTHIYIYIYIY